MVLTPDLSQKAEKGSLDSFYSLNQNPKESGAFVRSPYYFTPSALNPAQQWLKRLKKWWPNISFWFYLDSAWTEAYILCTGICRSSYFWGTSPQRAFPLWEKILWIVPNASIFKTLLAFLCMVCIFCAWMYDCGMLHSACMWICKYTCPWGFKARVFFSIILFLISSSQSLSPLWLGWLTRRLQESASFYPLLVPCTTTLIFLYCCWVLLCWTLVLILIDQMFLSMEPPSHPAFDIFLTIYLLRYIS